MEPDWLELDDPLPFTTNKQTNETKQNKTIQNKATIM